MNDEKKQLVLPEILTVKELAESFGVPVTQVIRELLKNGVLATINDNIDFETAAIISDIFGFEVVAAAKEENTNMADKENDIPDKGKESRAPIVTVMGHVDHGKTSLLDYIRKTTVVSGESGGITQHIGAYQVDYKGRKITFLDTPGHEAFSAIRAQGTKVTDVVILVVAADEGIKPQTIEAIELARAANVPLVVAITKIDRPEANIERVEQELAAHEIVTDKWGGKNVIVRVSGKTGEGVDELLDLVLLTADMQELKAIAKGPASGIMIETKHDKRVGVLGTLLIKQGILQVGDSFVVGHNVGKVRTMENDAGKRIKEASPSMPVQITGFSVAPSTGEMLRVVKNEKEAKSLATLEARRATVRKVSVKTSGLSKLTSSIRAAHSQNLAIVLKADVQGSLEAIKNQIAKIKTDKGKINIILDGLGDISESDVLAAAGHRLGEASGSESENALVVGFKVKVVSSALAAAKKDDIKIVTYDVIYELTDDLTKVLLESIGSERVEISAGTATVLKIFRDGKKDKIIGMKVVKGKAVVGNLVRFTRDDEVVGEGEIKTIKHLMEEVSEATPGEDFGFEITTKAKIKEGDKVEFIQVEHRKATIDNGE